MLVDTFVKTITRDMAAAQLAHQDFPSGSDLPRISRFASAYMGHLVLFDYGEYATLLWGMAFELRRRYDSWRQRRWKRLGIGAVVGGVVGGALGLLVHPVAGAIALVIVWPSLAKRLEVRDRTRMDADAEQLRVSSIQTLLEGALPSWYSDAVAQLQSDNWIPHGDGRLSTTRSPVLVSSERQLFPGYGLHQLSESFVCPPKTDAGAPLTLTAADRDICVAAFEAAQRGGFPSVETGSVILLNGATLRRDSPWLTDGIPVLWFNSARNGSPVAHDPIASVFCYHAVQVLFPSHATAATFFLRTFAAGASIAFEIALCTLGPPKEGAAHAEERLTQHQCGRQASQGGPKRKTNSGRAMEELRRKGQGRAVFPPLSSITLPDLRMRDKAVDEVGAELREIEQSSNWWARSASRLPNLREDCSWAFSQDFMARTEDRTSIVALYETMVRAILTRLDRTGYDISKYRSASGSITIKAEKIDTIQTGTIVNHASQGSTEPQSPAPASARS